MLYKGFELRAELRLRRARRLRAKWLSRLGAVVALIALIVAASEVAAQTNNTFTVSTTTHSTFTDSSRTDVVNTFSTRVTSRLDGGPILFDQTVTFAFDTPGVDLLLADALQAILNAALGQSPAVAGPNLVSFSTGLADSQNSIVQTLNHNETSVTLTVTTGPATILIGPEQSETHFVPSEFVNTNVNTHTESFYDRLFLTTETYLTSAHYELVGVIGQTTQVPEPAALLLFGAGLVGFGVARRRRAA